MLMCKMLLSINPEHVENIISGKKKYEYRRIRCKEAVDKIIIYATAPISQVVGEVEVLDIIEDSPMIVWDETKGYSGISKSFFLEYFSGKSRAVAYHLGEIQQYSRPKALSEFGVRSAPQSFVYITK